MVSQAERETLNSMSYKIVGCAIEAHRALGGPGLLESVYEDALCYELQQVGYFVERQLVLPVTYKEQLLSASFRLDVLVNNSIIVEGKAVIDFNPIFETQLLTYLPLSVRNLGLVINFGEKVVKMGVKRVLNDF